MKKFFENKFRTWFTIGAVSILLLAIGVGVWTYFQPILVINGQKITKEDVANNKGKYQRVFEYNKDKNSLDTINQTVRDLVIEKTVIETEAQKRGLSASVEEVDALYENYLKNYKSADEMKFAIQTAYGWSEADVRESLKLQILKQKLVEEVVSKRDVTSIYYRYDFNGEEGLALANPVMTQTYNNLKTGKTIEQEIARVKALNSDTWRMPNFGSMVVAQLNETTEKESFFGREDWVAIKKLQAVGDITEVVKSTGGYLAVYRLDAITDGGFANWGDFVQSFTGGTSNKVSLLDYLGQKFIKKANAACVAGLTLVNGCCATGTYTQNQMHYFWVGGSVNTITGTAINGATVTGNIVVDPNLTPPVCTNQVTTTATTTSFSYLAGSAYIDGWYWLGKNGDLMTLPCYWEWDITASYPGYLAQTKHIVAQNGVKQAATFYLSPVPVARYAVTYNGNGNTSGTVPVDTNTYTSGSSIKAKSNTGVLAKTGFTFSGWNTKSDGSGANISEGSTFTMGNANITLYARWNPIAQNLSCSVAPPTGGKVPLSIVVTVHNAIAGHTYNYDFNSNDNDGVNEYTGRGPVVTYSYSKAGSYTIKVTENGTGRSAFCPETPYPVTAPDDGSGGEVAP